MKILYKTKNPEGIVVSFPSYGYIYFLSNDKLFNGGNRIPDQLGFKYNWALSPSSLTDFVKLNKITLAPKKCSTL